VADDFNSMQAALGLVGQGGSFNPLGIATPAPPAPPIVRHPGEMSQDIVQRTQTSISNTLQTAAVTRPGGLGLPAPGASPLGAFAQQYQQNMAGINAMQPNIFSAQMMGMMGGMGGGFSPGMLPHPAMMTAPGMGIYRPFMPPPTPTVSPFPQMPFLPTPFTPMPPPAMFQTPAERMNQMAIQAGQSRTAAMFAAPGVAARAGADIGMGYMGAGVGASLGALWTRSNGTAHHGSAESIPYDGYPQPANARGLTGLVHRRRGPQPAHRERTQYAGRYSPREKPGRHCLQHRVSARNGRDVLS
jgi:hypothetical protein